MKLSTLLFSVLFILLCIPFAQQQFGIFHLKKLDGVELTSEKEMLTLKSWMDGAFQSKSERWINEHIGMREELVRIYNQYNFSCFHVTESPGVVIGKNDFLYLTSYTDNYLGHNFVGKEKAQTTIHKLKLLQDALKKKNIDLVIAFAPGKASFYPEYIPLHSDFNKSETNYYGYKEAIENERLNFIDLHAWFDGQKGKTPYKLYPKYGVHWTYYGSFLAADTLKKFIESIHHCNIPEMKLVSVALRDSLKQPDYDVGELLNIYTRFKDTLPYPQIQFSDVSNLPLPKLLIISDSYAWQWNELDVFKHLSNNWSFWFYNNTMYPESFTKTKLTSEINYIETLSQYDVIVVLASEGTLHMFPYGITDKAEALCVPGDNDGLITYYKEKIKSDPSWYDAVKQKAAAKNIPVEQAVEEDARWMAKEEAGKKH